MAHEPAVGRAIRPVATAEELAAAFDVVGAQLPQALTHQDGRFADLARRFPEDRALMLVAEDRGRLVGGALAFRAGPRNVTVRLLGVEPAALGAGLGRALLAAVEREAVRLGVTLVSLGAAEGAAGFYARLGYHEAGGAFHKAVGRDAASGERP